MKQFPAAEHGLRNNKVEEFDVIIIGGGATGLGVAVESASRGYKTILLEGHDFGTGTSSKSTKLIHGGIRYLANFDFMLVREGLSERYYFLKNAQHITSIQPYLVPLYSLKDKIKYYCGVKIYDLLAGKKKIGKSLTLNKQETLKIAPHLRPAGLRGSVVYFDGQFDDTRMLISLLRTFEDLGGIAHNYHQVVRLLKNEDFLITGVQVLDKLNNQQFNLFAKVVINATGTLTDTILDIDEPAVKHKNVAAAQGTHLIFNKDIFDSTHAIVIPETADGRVLFVLPWHNKVLVGTTDIAVEVPVLDPKAEDQEINFILQTLNKYTVKEVTIRDIKSVFTGQRPLVHPESNMDSAKISRKHEILISQSGLISIVGGKWTIYRLMGEDTINFAVNKKLLYPTKSVTRNLRLFGNTNKKLQYPLSVYGAEQEKILEINEELGDNPRLHPRLPYYIAEIIYQIRYEKAKTVEDILMRRTRAILLDAKAAIEIAPQIAKIMAQELNKNDNWIDEQLLSFNLVAQNYLAITVN
ncbi:MAG: glycerol-3-phosphate dehydrogenase/oxidase [Burkholderiales bacterium]|nr:glycerol-3-phosphate dehydrogenase/oxidase [Burkholderiales bacterium]